MPDRVVARRTERAGRRGSAILGAAVAGTLPALAFPEADIAWLGLVGLVPSMHLVRRARSTWSAAGLAWCAGTGYVAAVHHWLVPVLGGFALVVFPLVGLTWAPWGALAHRGLRGSPGAGRLTGALVGVPAAFVLGEVARARPLFGGPFGLLGSSQVGEPLLPLAALGGVWLVGFAAVAVNVALVVATLPGRTLPGRGAWAALALGLVALGPLAGVLVDPRAGGSGATVGVAGVQTGVVPGPRTRLARSLAATLALGDRALRDGALPGRPTSLVVWGESSVGGGGAGPEVTGRLAAASRRTGARLLVNVDARRGAGGIYKTALLVGPRGVEGRYDKTRLVPFGEYVPFRGALGWVSRVSDAAPEDRRRGRRLVVLGVPGLRLGPLICFESAFPDMARSLVRGGAGLLVVQSATTTFQGSWGQAQHAALAAVRAVETGRPVLHVALSGVSAAYDARGERLAGLGSAARGAFTVDLPLAAGTTPYVRFGDWVPVGSLLLVGAMVLRPAGGALRRRRPGAPVAGRTAGLR